MQNTDQKNGYFPSAYYNDFLRFLDRNRDKIVVLNYDDYDWGNDFNYKDNYPQEKNLWDQKIRDGEIDNSKIYITLQHDVDNFPDRTLQAMIAERSFGFTSNVMLFNKRVLRRHLQQTGEILFDTEKYTIDRKLWKEFQDDGFVFCYHLNAYEQAGFSKEKALAIFISDVAELRQDFDIKYFSPHGGPKSPGGESNNCLSIPAILADNIRWVANGQTIRFDGVYSDGGPNSKTRDPETRDLKDFVKTWRPGKRYRVITHPQYYRETKNAISERLNEASWYKEMQRCYQEEGQDYWSNLMIDFQGEVDSGPSEKTSFLFLRKLQKSIFGTSKK